MRTVRTKVYLFNELTQTAKQKAISQHRNGQNTQFYFDEIIESVKQLAELFNLKFGREYTDIRYSHIDDCILELKGIRLYKYLMNNYGYKLFKPAYIKTVDKAVFYKQFICKVSKGKNGEYTQIYSRQKRTNDCVLTGFCYDNDILQPVYNFLARPYKYTTFEDLIKDIESAIQKCFETVEDWVNSDEFIIDEIEANEYEFTEDGNIF